MVRAARPSPPPPSHSVMKRSRAAPEGERGVEQPAVGALEGILAGAQRA